MATDGLFGAVSISTSAAVGAESIVHVTLGSAPIVVTLPGPAVAGRLVIVTVIGHSGPPGTNNVVSVIPNPNTPANKINGIDSVDLWELHSHVAFIGIGASGWQALASF